MNTSQPLSSFRRESTRGFNNSSYWGHLLCPCCPQRFLKSVQAVQATCLNCVYTTITGLNKIERTLLGVSVLDIIVLQYPTPRKGLDSAIVKRTEIQLLSKFPDLYQFFNDSTTEDQFNAEVEALASSLQIKTNFLPSLREVLLQSRLAHQARHTIFKQQRTPFELNNPIHIEYLHKLWNLLTDNKPLPNRETEQNHLPTKKQTEESQFNLDSPEHEVRRRYEYASHPFKSWCDIGFQSEDPWRDFRGAGVLGCLNLLSFAEKHTLRARNVLKEANSIAEQRLWFPFAATGLNITIWLTAFLEKGHLDVFFYNNSLPPTDIFNVIYSFAFLEFSRFWQLSRPVNILQFGAVSKQFLKNMEGNLSEISNPACHSEWNVLQTSTGEELTEELRSWIDGSVHPVHGHNTSTPLNWASSDNNDKTKLINSPSISKFLAKFSSAPAGVAKV